MKFIIFLLMVSFMSSCSSSKRNALPTAWTYENAKFYYDNLKSDYPKLYEEADWIDKEIACTDETSSFSFPKKGLQDLQKKITYPLSARTSGVQGEVVAEYTVLENGMVTNIKVLRSPSPELSNVVRQMLLSTKFVPAYCNKLPAKSKNIFRINFTLHDY